MPTQGISRRRHGASTRFCSASRVHAICWRNGGDVSDGLMRISDGALARFLDALAVHRGRLVRLVAEVERELAAGMARLEYAHDEAQREAGRNRDRLNSSVETDRERREFALESAEEHLQQVDRDIERVAHALDEFRRANQDIRSYLDKALPGMVIHLEDKQRLLQEYLSHRLGEFAETAITVAQGAPVIVTGDSKTNLRHSLLPAGFVWIPLDQISAADDLRPDERFHKVSREEVVAGFGMLEDVVLPAIGADPSIDAEHFRALDQSESRAGRRRTLAVYEAFFGQSAIALTRRQRDGKFGVTNGRHRIRVARDLGWSAVPVRFI